MKSRNTRTVFFFFLICLSLASFIYLNVAASAKNSDTVEQMEASEASEEEGAINLPDVRMLRTVIESGKRILPTS